MKQTHIIKIHKYEHITLKVTPHHTDEAERFSFCNDAHKHKWTQIQFK